MGLGRKNSLNIDKRFSGISCPTGGLGPCEIFASDEILNRIQVFDEKGTYKRKWSVGGTGGVHGINVYTPTQEVVSSEYHNNIKIWDYNGNYKRGWARFWIQGLFVYNNEIYECNDGDKYIIVDDLTTGAVTKSLALNATPNDCHIYNNELYVTMRTQPNGNCVRVYNLNLVFQRQWGSYGSGNGQFSDPSGIRGYKGEIFVCDFTNNRVQVFDIQGNFQRKWDSPKASYCDIYTDIILVGSCNLGKIEVYDLFGYLKGEIGSLGSDDGQFQMVDWISIRPL